MIPPALDYAEPKTLDEAIALLATPEAKSLAGGHSLIPMLKFRLATPTLLVDINKIEGRSYIREEGEWLKIGAMTREYDLEMSVLEAALRSPAACVGLVASRKRRDAVLDCLRGSGLNENELARLHCPTGLDLGAVTPDEIALSSLASRMMQPMA